MLLLLVLKLWLSVSTSSVQILCADGIGRPHRSGEKIAWRVLEHVSLRLSCQEG